MNRSTTTTKDNGGSLEPQSESISGASKPDPASTIRVLLADDHPVVRWGLSCSFASHPRIRVIGEAADGLETLRKARALRPDVILMDIGMPELNGVAATEVLRRELPNTKVLLLSMHPYHAQMRRILQSGARGFLLKETRPAEVLDAICKVADGETCFSASVASQALKDLAESPNGHGEVNSLTERERQVLVGIAEGFSNKDIALQLGISARTIETHRSHIMRKLKIRTVAGLTRFAVSEGLVEIHKLTP